MRETTALMLISNKITYAKQRKSKTLIINLLGGPCAGKSKIALLLTGRLKELGIRAEYVSEVAKDHVYNHNSFLLDGSMRNQTKILIDQLKRLNCPYFSGMVDIIVTDSPIILNAAYNIDASKDYIKKVSKLSNCYNNIYFFIDRDNHFDKVGRNQNTLDECIELDTKIKGILKKTNTQYSIVKAGNIEKILNKIVLHGQKSPKKATKKTKPRTNNKKPKNTKKSPKRA